MITLPIWVFIIILIYTLPTVLFAFLLIYRVEQDILEEMKNGNA